MRNLIAFILFFYLPFLSSASGVLTITHTPQNPVIGELVTFTYMNDIGGPVDECWRPNPANMAQTTELFPEGAGGVSATYVPDMGNSNPIEDGPRWTHIYTQPGMYTYSLDCADNQNTATKGPESKAVVQARLTGTIFVAAPIPTMSQWGLIVLALCLLSIGIVALRSKKLKMFK